MSEMNIFEKLLGIQTELKAPKNQKATDFKTGKVRYQYRSCEDILEAVKPLLKKYRCSLYMNDFINERGERVYVEATAFLVDIDNPEARISNSAYARETLDNGRMDVAQVTGAASSYARKYALNGLFLIDDTKDVDTDEYREKKTEEKEEKKAEKKEQTATDFQIKKMQEICEANDLNFDIETAKKMTMKEASDFINKMAKGE